ncbi:hypothetical protein J437_LFUL010434 [Ladona fulva]|uniref:Uncharacterized protein n=1 Tax=Ladona fulva TaxID=123851 RepID=A0A8K0K9E6_LADFU|nr:hypothetical protein J437_LFUL010434 [Ladona fulva]
MDSESSAVRGLPVHRDILRQAMVPIRWVNEKIDKSIGKPALQKINQHLRYFTDEFSVLSLFDDDVDQETKLKMVENVTKENLSTHSKRYIPSKEELCGPLYGKLDKKISTTSLQSEFDRLKIDDSFLHECSTISQKEGFNAEGSDDDTAERAEEQKQFLLRCEQEHRKIYPDYKNQTLKR